MPPPITIDILDRMRPNLASLVMERAKRLPGMRYCDLRLQVKPESTERRLWGQSLKKPEGAPLNLG